MVVLEELQLPPRQILALVLRAAVAHLESRKLLEKVRPHLPPDTAALIANPPMRLRWLSAEHTDNLYRALEKVAPREELQALGLGIARGTSTAVLAPIVKMATTVFGASPAAFFENLERFWTVPTRGLAFRWHPTDDRSGLIVTHFATPVPEASSLDALEGNLQFIFEAVGVKGTIGEREVVKQAKNHVVLLKARW